MTRRDSGHAVLIVVIIIIALAILGLLGWLFWNNFINKPTTTTSNHATTSGTSNTPAQQVTTKTYCTQAEKLCFEYPQNWMIDDSHTVNSQEPGFKGDYVYVMPPNKELTLKFQSAIDGIGGTCDPDSAGTVKLLDPTPVASLSGYADQYNVDEPVVVRVVGQTSGKYTATLFATTSKSSTQVGTVSACDIGFGEFIKGRYSVLSSNYAGAGLFVFTSERAADSQTTYASQAEAEAVFDTEIYKQAVGIIASLHYQ